MLISIVIVNFNAGDLIISCIQSIIRETKLTSYEIIVVDNDSSDNSIKAIKNKFPSVKVIETGRNLGFAKGNNIGFKVATGDYILVLNPDTLITQQAIDQCVSYMMVHPEVGGLGCQVLSESGQRKPSVIRFLTLAGILINTFLPYKIVYKSQYLDNLHYAALDYDLEQDVEAIVGCFMMLPRTVIDEVGGFDEDFFMYVEEIEWCWRIAQTGKKIRYYPESTIVHHGGGCSASLGYRKTLFMAKGSLLFFKKTRGVLSAKFANLLMIFRDSPRAFIWLFFRFFHRQQLNRVIFFKQFYLRVVYLCLHLIGVEQKI